MRSLSASAEIEFMRGSGTEMKQLFGPLEDLFKGKVGYNFCTGTTAFVRCSDREGHSICTGLTEGYGERFRSGPGR